MVELTMTMMMMVVMVVMVVVVVVGGLQAGLGCGPARLT